MATEEQEVVESTKQEGAAQEAGGTTNSEESTLTPEELMQKYHEERAAKARILDEKKKVKSQYEELSQKLQALENEKKQKELAALSVEDRLTVLQQEAEAREREWREQLQAKDQELSKFQRSVKIKEYTGDLKFKSDVPGDITEHIISKAFADIDINDMSQVHAAKKSIAEKYASFVLAEAPKGAGTNAVKSTQSSAATTSITPEQYMAMDQKERVKLPKAEHARLMTQTKVY